MHLPDNVVLQRRLLLGVVATVALGAFALVPTDSLRLGKPTKPLFLYLIPLIRVQVSLLLLLPVSPSALCLPALWPDLLSRALHAPTHNKIYFWQCDMHACILTRANPMTAGTVRRCEGDSVSSGVGRAGQCSEQDSGRAQQP